MGKKKYLLSFFPFHSSVYNFIRIKKGPWNNHQNVMWNSQTNKPSDPSEKLNLNLINKWSVTQGFYCILTMRLIILKTIKDKKGINKWCQLYTVLPFSLFSMCSHQQYPFHRFGIVFPELKNAFLKLGSFAATGFALIWSKHWNPSLHT